MKKLIVVAALVAASFSALADSTGATTNWVAQFVREYVGNALSNSTASIAADAKVTTTNGASMTVFTAGGYEIGYVFETADQPALVAADCGAGAATYGVTNGFLWAWSDQGNRYINKATDPIIPTQTNFTFRGVASIEQGGKTLIRNAEGQAIFEVKFTTIQKSVADELKGEN